MTVFIWQMKDFIILRDKLNKGWGVGKQEQTIEPLSPSQYRNASGSKSHFPELVIG